MKTPIAGFWDKEPPTPSGLLSSVDVFKISLLPCNSSFNGNSGCEY
jgi:hypothetical protein